jgi:CHAT domain-containing protein
MNKPILIALLPLALLASSAVSAQAAASTDVPTIVGVSKTQMTSYDRLYTEANWQRVQLPDQAAAMLGNLKAVTLSVSGLPANVQVSLSSKTGPAGSVGLQVSRSDQNRAVNQMGTFTLTNPATQQSYTFDAMVTGSGK